MGARLSVDLQRQLVEADDHCCAYCQTCTANSGQPLTVDHIVPVSQGGATQFENLCFACRQCNEFKGAQHAGVDPLTGERTPLFNPRRELWETHFSWDDGYTRVVGLTAVGRATVIALNMNNEVVVQARHRWVAVGWHPPRQ